MTDRNSKKSDWACHRIASRQGDAGQFVNWNEHAHIECAALDNSPWIPGRAPGVFDVDIYDCEVCGGIIGDPPLKGNA
jgi:hypothetical protein